MKLLAWNCRRFRATSTIRRLSRIVKGKHPVVVFLAKTICSVHCTTRFFNPVGLANVFGIDPQGRSGGLVLAWADFVRLNILDISPNWIHVSYSNENGVVTHVTFVYGHPKVDFRYVVWDFLSNLAPSLVGPWMILGDFNQIKGASDKLSANLSLRGVVEFQTLINNLGLIDYIPKGPWFTWNNNRSGNNAVLERLDRVLIRPDWLDVFPHMTADTLNISASDHAPIFVSLKYKIPLRSRPFRFEAMWLHEGACDNTVLNA